VLANKIFATLQYSQKKFGCRGAGGTDTAITASPFMTRGLTPGGGEYYRSTRTGGNSQSAMLNINTGSLYLQDHRVATPRLSIDLGTLVDTGNRVIG
jgi:hypothetical protein